MDGATARAVLGVAPGASFDTIRAAFRRLAKHTHPDTGAPTADADAFARLHQAFDVLAPHAPRTALVPRWFDASAPPASTFMAWDDVPRHRRPSAPAPSRSFADVLAEVMGE